MRSYFVAVCIALTVPLMGASASAQLVPSRACPAGAPRDQAQRGWQEQAQGHWVQAEACLRAVVAVATDPWVQSHRAQLDPSLRIVSEHVGGLQVLGGVPGARVRVDGVEVATLPMAPLRVQATRVLVQVSAEGYRTTERNVTIPAGDSAWVETIPLVAAEPPPPLPPQVVVQPTPRQVDVTPHVAVTPRVVVTTTTAPTTVMEPHASSARTWAWVSAVGAVGVLGAGTVAEVFHQNAMNTYNDASNHCPSTWNGQGTSSTCSNAASTFNTTGPLAIAGFAVGGALAVTSLVLFIVSSGSQVEEHPHASLECRPGPGIFGLQCGGRF